MPGKKKVVKKKVVLKTARAKPAVKKPKLPPLVQPAKFEDQKVAIEEILKREGLINTLDKLISATAAVGANSPRASKYVLIVKILSQALIVIRKNFGNLIK